MYFGIGTGYEFEPGVFFEVMYKNYYGKITDSGERDINYNIVSAAIGYKFKI